MGPNRLFRNVCKVLESAVLICFAFFFCLFVAVSGFRREVAENCALLGYYVMSNGDFRFPYAEMAVISLLHSTVGPPPDILSLSLPPPRVRRAFSLSFFYFSSMLLSCCNSPSLIIYQFLLHCLPFHTFSLFPSLPIPLLLGHFSYCPSLPRFSTYRLPHPEFQCC